MPKSEVRAPQLLERWGQECDGRGVVVIVLDTGVDPGAAGLSVTPAGEPKVLDIRDCTGSGDVALGAPTKPDADGTLPSPSDPAKRLAINSAWRNPSGEYRLGYIRAWQLFPGPLKRRFAADRAAAFDDAHAAAASVAAARLAAVRADKEATKKDVAEAEAAVEALEKERAAFHADDPGPAIDAALWHDGTAWRVALDTTGLAVGAGPTPTGGDGVIALADCPPLTNFAAERQWVTLDARSAANVGVNVWDGGEALEVVCDAGEGGGEGRKGEREREGKGGGGGVCF
jgi:tripeptidyl-peptidase-2